MSHLLDRLTFFAQPTEDFADGHGRTTGEDRTWEDAYRNRWQHDKIVRSTHGVNCTGSCSWKIYVKSGIVTWETQQTDYPRTRPDLPNHEPRGCARGASYSWYLYSANRVKTPLIRGRLMRLWREKRKTMSPIEAWTAIQNDPAARESYTRIRGKGGFVRASWDEATEIVAAANAYTTRKYGPDRVFGFSPIPAMSMISYAAGTRYLSLLGGTCMSFYDWYCDLPPASPEIWGEQTDVNESADWYNSRFIAVMGADLNMTRTPDTHFVAEVRHAGAKLTVFSPDFSQVAKYADYWIPLHAGQDTAFWMAVNHVILKEAYVDRQVPYFVDYVKQYTDLPFLVQLSPAPAGEETVARPGKYLRANQLAAYAGQENGDWKLLVWDKASGRPRMPKGTIGFRWQTEKGHWNLEMRDGATGEDLDPELSFLAQHDAVAQVAFDDFAGGGTQLRGVPVRTIETSAGLVTVTTVFDLLMAQFGVGRKLPGAYPASYDDDACYTPAWQEELTGVPANADIRIGREFAQNADDSQGRSQIIMGAGVNHYFHADNIYRTFLALTSMCGTQGVNGGGWAHYVGQEKLRPMNGWSQYAFALDWQRPARQMITTGFYYLTTDQWRYDNSKASRLASPLANRGVVGDKHLSDTLIESMKRGWMPAYPQFNRNPLLLADEAEAKGMDIKDYVVSELESGNMQFAAEDPDAPENWPRILLNWRTNLMGSSAKGTEFFLRHMLGVDSDATAVELEPHERPESIAWRDEAPQGKLDLMLTTDFRNTSTTLVSDIVLPAATWYEKHDLSTTDMHPFIHSFNAAINPPWEARTDFEVFRDLSKAVSEQAVTWLGTQTDLITAPLGHDSPDELNMPNGIVPDIGESGLVPGKTMAKLIPVERDYTRIHEKWTHLGPLTADALSQFIAGGLMNSARWIARDRAARLDEQVIVMAVHPQAHGHPIGTPQLPPLMRRSIGLHVYLQQIARLVRARYPVFLRFPTDRPAHRPLARRAHPPQQANQAFSFSPAPAV